MRISAKRVTGALQQQLGQDNIEVSAMSMGGEDFSRYGKAGVPSLMFWLGAVSQEPIDIAETSILSCPNCCCKAPVTRSVNPGSLYKAGVPFLILILLLACRHQE
jgi:metal-dependent amidase/aminoacylase/carboxypeptidase family protein